MMESKKKFFTVAADNEAEAARIRKALQAAGLKFTEKDACKIAYIVDVTEGRPLPVNFD